MDKVKIRYFQRRLFVNSDMLHDSNMIFAANCICHEMIHMFDQKFGEGEDAMMKSSRLQIDINTHSTPTFMKMKKKAMRDRMKIIDDGQGITYEQLNKEAYDFMISESENPPPLKLEKGDDSAMYVDMSDIMYDVGGFKMTGKHSGVMIYCD